MESYLIVLSEHLHVGYLTYCIKSFCQPRDAARQEES